MFLLHQPKVRKKEIKFNFFQLNTFSLKRGVEVEVDFTEMLFFFLIRDSTFSEFRNEMKRNRFFFFND